MSEMFMSVNKKRMGLMSLVMVLFKAYISDNSNAWACANTFYVHSALWNNWMSRFCTVVVCQNPHTKGLDLKSFNMEFLWATLLSKDVVCCPEQGWSYE